MKRLIEDWAIKTGYGQGFWILVAGILLVTTLLLQSESHSSPKTVVERIPASELDVRSN